MALRYILAIGGTGYFRTRAVEPHLKAGRLHRVSGAPAFSYAVHAAFSRRSDRDLLEWALEQAALVAQHPADSWA